MTINCSHSDSSQSAARVLLHCLKIFICKNHPYYCPEMPEVKADFSEASPMCAMVVKTVGQQREAGDLRTNGVRAASGILSWQVREGDAFYLQSMASSQVSREAGSLMWWLGCFRIYKNWTDGWWTVSWRCSWLFNLPRQITPERRVPGTHPWN